MSNRRVDSYTPGPAPELREDEELAELAELTSFAQAIGSAFGRPRLEPTERERVERIQSRVLQRLGFAAAAQELKHFQLFAVRSRPTRQRKPR